MSTQKIRWGILACGKIARKFASDLQYVEGAELVAVASRSIKRAREFTAEYPARHVLGSYEALVALEDVDIIYVASPHSHHHQHTLLCLNNGKAVFCEKAFALNSNQAQEMVDLARRKNLFLMEALWTRFLPHYAKVREMIAVGMLGNLKGVVANFGFLSTQTSDQRHFNPALGGGSLLDIGIYNVFLAQSILGKPDEIIAAMTPASTGVDEQCSIIFKYKNGSVASLFSSFASNLETDADIFGTGGRIRLTNRFYEPTATIQYYPDQVDSRTLVPVEKEPGWGYQHEIRHVVECLNKGLKESPVWGLDETMALMETLDQVREKIKLDFFVGQ